MNNDSTFTELLIEDYKEPLLLETINNSDIEWFSEYNFLIKEISPEILSKDRFFKWLMSHYEFRAGICRVPEFTCYDWHKDIHRGVSINMLINESSDHHSHCFFSLNRDYAKKRILSKRITNNFMELCYKPYRRYVVNNQHDHIIFNFDETRYLFTINFELTKDKLNYNDFISFLIKHQREWM